VTHPALWRWLPGRQSTGYRKLLLASGATWDAYLIDYPCGSFVPPHRDPVDGEKQHYRLNVTIYGDPKAFWAWGRGVVRRFGRFVLFRPDRDTHGVYVVAQRRLVLSIGWIIARNSLDKSRPPG
jgi:hypothetical protein